MHLNLRTRRELIQMVPKPERDLTLSMRKAPDLTASDLFKDIRDFSVMF
jgi:hypothetical protein